MLQILGWMGCAYLVIKGFEVLASAGDKPLAKVAAGIAFCSAVLFLILIDGQFRGNAAAEAGRQFQVEDPEGYANMANEMGFENENRL